jgi:hypothetical protein
LSMRGRGHDGAVNYNGASPVIGKHNVSPSDCDVSRTTVDEYGSQLRLKDRCAHVSCGHLNHRAVPDRLLRRPGLDLGAGTIGLAVRD